MALAASTGLAASVACEIMARGRESAAALEALLQGASMTPAPGPHGGLQLQDLAAQIIRCCDRALAALHGKGAVDAAAGGSTSRKRRSPPSPTVPMRPKRSRARGSGAEVPTRVEKRCTPEDGLLWRKYGQKDIQNTKYPRLYFRCTYKHDTGCMATRQVQQSEDGPSLYVVTYFGEHTCGAEAAAATVRDAEEVHQLVINFGSGTASSGSPWASSSENDVQSETSQLTQAVCFPEEAAGGQREKVCRVESAPPPAGPSSPADVSCASLDLEPLLRHFDWDYFSESSFDIVDEFIHFDEITRLLYHD